MSFGISFAPRRLAASMDNDLIALLGDPNVPVASSDSFAELLHAATLARIEACATISI
jgi:hypothetical protein